VNRPPEELLLPEAGARGGAMPRERSRVIPLADLRAYGAAFTALAAGDSGLQSFLPPAAHYREEAARRRQAIPPLDRSPLWAETAAIAREVAAPPAALAAIEALGRGAPLIFTGQQPGLFGGPLYTYFKTATAIALARELAHAWGEPVVPVFWIASDDSDFAEIAAAEAAGPNLERLRFALPADFEPDRMVGHLPATAGREEVARAPGLLAPGPATQSALALAGPVWERGQDWGRGFASHLYALWGDLGLVVVDARLPALRTLAAPLFARYLADPAGYARTVDGAGEALLGRGFERQLGAHAAALPLWREEPPYRHRLADAEAATAILEGGGPAQLWAGVAIRPLAVDWALPTVARVLGPAEVAYMAQLAPAYARLELALPPALPRLTGTLAPAAVRELAARVRPADPGRGLDELIIDPAAASSAAHRAALPPAVRSALDELEAAQRAGFARARVALADLGRGLDQLVDSVAGKADFQLGRLWEAAVKREKSRWEEEHPAAKHVAEFVRPDQGLQERRLSVVGGLALGGLELRDQVLAAAEEHLDRLRSTRSGHHVFEVNP
jgi:bacillithiol synthase